MRWPLWTKIYAVIIGAPMIAVSLALVLWIILIGFGDTLATSSFLGRRLVSTVYIVAFLTTAYLFYIAVRRIIFDQPEALLYAATGHLLLAMPAAMFSVVSYARQPVSFINNINRALDDVTLNQPMRFLLWVVFHTYLALWLSLLDRSSP
ncbi:MAG: hypothetical protein CUN55_03120 [Phototrophicales bacterium]|nr:MAG: hypothetical protein CUN55_03120 [Phototrophicales bacterium]